MGVEKESPVKLYGSLHFVSKNDTCQVRWARALRVCLRT